MLFIYKSKALFSFFSLKTIQKFCTIFKLYNMVLYHYYHHHHLHLRCLKTICIHTCIYTEWTKIRFTTSFNCIVLIEGLKDIKPTSVYTNVRQKFHGVLLAAPLTILHNNGCSLHKYYIFQMVLFCYQLEEMFLI